MTGNANVDTATAIVLNKVAELNAVKADAVKVIRDNFKDLFVGFFEKHPAVECIGWTQYTPYFNDGDTCEFNVHDFGYRTFADADNDQYIWGGSVTGRYWDYPTRTYVVGLTEDQIALGYTEEMCADWNELDSALRGIPDDIYEDLFGDHAQITVTREGVTVDEYEHD